MAALRFEKLDREKYEGYPLEFAYTTDRYYHVNASEWGFTLEERWFDALVEKGFTDHLFSEWLEDPIAIGAFDGDKLAGVIEGSIEAWHDVFRISNILVYPDFRGQGVGSALMARMEDHARSIPGCRGLILETQSCNYPAISFYRKQGFALSRIDIREYSDEDIQRREVRLDLYKPLRR